ncbi:hypothetical protein INT48_006256 [Thamnidium elegans]|uniref:Cysteine-rich protein n=1 Tax=Thamnidium elegans TaxID=101142 RepID=A0A8H7VP90_9FUNG|nr:hypothetical protein INT48_006256 [Thamnidium elegans]
MKLLLPFVLFATLIETSYCGSVVFGIYQQSCISIAAKCYDAAGVSTPLAVIGCNSVLGACMAGCVATSCNSALGVCMAGCVAAGFAPTL